MTRARHEDQLTPLQIEALRILATSSPLRKGDAAFQLIRSAQVAGRVFGALTRRLLAYEDLGTTHDGRVWRITPEGQAWIDAHPDVHPADSLISLISLIR